MSAILPSRFPSWAERRWLPRTMPALEGGALLAVVIVAVAALAGAHHLWPTAVPVVSLVPPCLVVTMLCPIGEVRVVFGLVLAYVGFSSLATDEGITRNLPLLISLALMYALAASRSHHGAAAFAGNRMLGDLRTRLLKMGDIPTLPRGWHAERSFATAHGNAFAGDFNVTSRSRCGSTLEVVLSDVSGKGQEAGTRALVLAGALGGVIGSTEPEHVLPMANDFLERDGWDEGFATAVHVCLDMTTGEATVASAGHPPAMHYDAGCGRWSALDEVRGPALGLTPHAEYPQVRTVLQRGDALLIYTDGIIESRARDLDDGIDWMLGVAEARGAHGFSGLVKRLVADGRAGEDDDRAAVLIWRD
ncbi:PP2C family protein-serine/threonine phosphatase [Janibacter anophelis]|uniref:PP2C family protein-serine/threonine phosphatase n=1 Tax=Janibacter anophelis TaxID=319054 RepID=UPI0008321F1F|nr:PP2C family protein-serine/threonine phosphatase [Janibacter anophelis]